MVIIPLNPRVRDNNVFGTVDDNPLSAGATTLNSTGLVNMSVIAAKHATITLDPLRQYGSPEIIIVTAHTVGSTVATVTRGAYSTSPRSHVAGTLWVHAPLDEDFIEIATSAIRPSDPYEGQFIFESDTNKLVGYGGIDWAPRDAGGQLGYTQIVANTASFTALADVAGLSAIVTVGTGRRVRIVWRGDLLRSVADGTSIIFIAEGATILSRAQGFARTAGESFNSVGSVIITPSAGPHTYKIQGQTTTGTGNTLVVANTDNPAFILVEDIGAA